MLRFRAFAVRWAVQWPVMAALALLLFLTSLASPAFAVADKATLTSELQVHNVVKGADGAEVLLPALRVKPGDLLQYTAVYKNADSRAVSQLVATMPIPAGTELVAASALPREVQASLDGKVFAPVPLLRKQRRADGQMVDVAVPLNEYRTLRWPDRQLAAGATFSTSARVRVLSLVELTAPNTAAPTVPTATPATPVLMPTSTPAPAAR